MNLNTTQKSLVKDSRRVWWRGFRHDELSSDIRRAQLIDTLASVVPEHSFATGVVNTGDARTDWETPDLSSPCDIVVHTGEPWEQLEDYVVVPSSDVHCIIEVESWLSADDLSADGTVTDRITRLQNETGLPVFLVAFRHQTEKATLVSNSVADRTFVLASGENGKTRELVYEGELEELVDVIEDAATF